MAQELKIRRNGTTVKVRKPVAAALLPYVTLGIYHVVWWYRVNRELRDYGDSVGHDLGRSPMKSALAVFPGCFLVVPTLVTYYRGTKRVQSAARIAGQTPVNGWLALVMYLVLAPILWGYLQASLNSVWRRVAGLDGPSAPRHLEASGREIRSHAERTARVAR
jgi:hypothetical protein